MKKFSRISVVLLISLLCVLGLSTTAFAEETQSSNGLQASIVTDSDEYKISDDIKVDFKVKNTNGFDINGVSMNTVVPKGLTVKDNAPTNKDVGTLKSGKEESYSVILNANGTGSNTHNNTNTTNELPKSGNTTNNESTVGTGDTTNVVILAIILVIAAVVIICNRKKLSKHISVMLCFAVCLTSIPMISMSSANAAEQDSFTVNKTVKIDGKNYTVGLKISYENNTHSNNVQPSDNESVVTRGEWVEMLATEFSMKEVSKSDTELPYSDISDSKYCPQIVTAYYHSILPTNIEKFKPDEYATRDFAAYTLNNCLCYIKNSNLKCSDFDSIKYKDAVSALTERGYFKLENDRFMPEKAVTTTEMDKIKLLIAQSLEGLKIDENHENVIDVNDDAVIIYDNVIKSIDGNTVTLIVSDETSKIKEGSIFFVPNPENVVQMLSYKAESISVSDGKIIVVTSTPDIAEMYDKVDIQGIAKSDVNEIDVQNTAKSKVVVNASRDVKASSSVGDSINNKFNELLNPKIHKDNTISIDAEQLRFDGKYTIGDENGNQIEVELKGGLENPEIAYNINFEINKFHIEDGWNFYVSLKNKFVFDGKATLISKDYKEGKYTIAEIPFDIGCPGVSVNISLVLVVSANGEITVNYELENKFGVKIDSKNGIQLVSEFSDSQPEITALAEAKIGMQTKIALIVANCEVISANEEIGAKGSAKIRNFSHKDGHSPHTDLFMYIYANIGYDTNDFIKEKCKLLGWNAEGTKPVIKEDNSPFKINIHVEKLTIVKDCTYRYVSGIVKIKGYPLDGVKVSVYDSNKEITLGEGQNNLTSSVGTFGFLIPCKSDNTNYSNKLTFKFSKDGYNDYIKEYTIKTAEDTDIGEIEMTASGDDNGKVYTAAELINMNLNEIIDIMGGDFTVDSAGYDPIRGTSPVGVCIYNYDVLPGFKFCIPKANVDNINGQDVKSNIKSGKYGNYEYIYLSEKAKLTDKISANMTYNELVSVIGEFDCVGAAVASGCYFYTTNTVGDITRYVFPPNDSLINSGINEVKRDWLRNNNPTLSGIIVYPKSQGEINPDTSEWARAYANYIQDYINSDNAIETKFALGYIDDDDVPELFIMKRNLPINIIECCTYKNGEIAPRTGFGTPGDSGEIVYYIYAPKQDIISLGWYRIGNLDGHLYGNGKDIYYGYNYDEFAGKRVYYYLGKRVTEQEYNDAINQYTDNYQFVKVEWERAFNANETNINALKNNPLEFLNPNEINNNVLSRDDVIYG